ncbi:hypothetical protein BGX30_009401, partial [Mortierella sp. GBA39]
ASIHRVGKKTYKPDLKVSKTARFAVQRLSDTPITTATALIEVNNAQEIRSEVKEDARSFFFSNKRRRQVKTQRLRTSRSYATLAALQRRRIKSEAREEIQQKLKAKDQTNTQINTESQGSQQEATMTSPEDPIKIE